MKGYSLNHSVKSLLSILSGKNVLFLCHTHADIDSLSSSFALSQFFSIHSKTFFGIPESLSPLMKKRVKKIKMRPFVVRSLKKFDVVVCVDFRSPSQSGSLSSQLEHFSGKIVSIDHHSPSSLSFSKKAFSIINPKASATAELVCEMGKTLHSSFTPHVSMVLAVAILEDSYGFSSANRETFECFSFLLAKSKCSYDSLWNMAFPEDDVGKRISLLKSLRNTELYSIGDFIFSFVYSPHQTASVSSSLISLGSDVSIAWYSSMDFIFSSIRVSHRAKKELNLDASKIVLSFLEKHDGIGGGHALASQLNIPSYFSENIIRDWVKRILLEKVRKKNGKAMVRKR